MSINYFGHSAYGLAESTRLLGRVRQTLPSETWLAIELSDAKPLQEPFGAEIAREFGIDALSRFTFTLIDTDRAYLYRPALIATAYRLFGAGRLVITWELDFIVPPPPDPFETTCNS